MCGSPLRPVQNHTGRRGSAGLLPEQPVVGVGGGFHLVSLKIALTPSLSSLGTQAAGIVAAAARCWEESPGSALGQHVLGLREVLCLGGKGLTSGVKCGGSSEAIRFLCGGRGLVDCFLCI